MNTDVSVCKLAQDTVRLLKKRRLRLSFAESCTGGMVSAAITSAAGSSAVLDISVITYSNWAKIEYTDVTEEVLSLHGAVSKETAVLMASGIRKRSGADIGIGITGIAGPNGGSPEKPVGTVYVAIDSDFDSQVRHFTFKGDRQTIREETTKQVLIMLQEKLE